MKTLKLYGAVRSAIGIKIKRKKYLLLVVEENCCSVIKIIAYSDIDNKEPQELLCFENSVFVKITYDGKYLYVAKRNMENKLEKYLIHQENCYFFVSKEKEIKLPYEDGMIQSMASSENGKIAIFDIKDGNIYEIVNDELVFVKSTRQPYCISNQNLCYIGEQLCSTYDTKISESTKSVFSEYEFALGKFNVNSEYLICYYKYSNEIIFGKNNFLSFENEKGFSGLVFLGDKKIMDIDIFDKDLIVSCYDIRDKACLEILSGSVIIYNTKDIIKQKNKAFNNIGKIKGKITHVIKMIAICSGVDYETFNNFSSEFKDIGVYMYDALKRVYKEHLVGKEAFEKYRKYKIQM